MKHDNSQRWGDEANDLYRKKRTRHIDCKPVSYRKLKCIVSGTVYFKLTTEIEDKLKTMALLGISGKFKLKGIIAYRTSESSDAPISELRIAGTNYYASAEYKGSGKWVIKLKGVIMFIANSSVVTRPDICAKVPDGLIQQILTAGLITNQLPNYNNYLQYELELTTYIFNSFDKHVRQRIDFNKYYAHLLYIDINPEIPIEGQPYTWLIRIYNKEVNYGTSLD